MEDQRRDAPWNATWRARKREGMQQIQSMKKRLSTLETKSDPRYARQEPDEQLHSAS